MILFDFKMFEDDVRLEMSKRSLTYKDLAQILRENGWNVSERSIIDYLRHPKTMTVLAQTKLCDVLELDPYKYLYRHEDFSMFVQLPRSIVNTILNLARMNHPQYQQAFKDPEFYMLVEQYCATEKANEETPGKPEKDFKIITLPSKVRT